MLLVLLGCGAEAPDPQLVALKQSIADWERGEAALEAGAPDRALEAFDAALEQRPGDPLLLSWRARALAESGELEAAVAVLDEVLLHDGSLVEARYNRAAYEARLGQPEISARDLKEALIDGGLPARDVLEDPDFQPYLGHPAFDFLPEDTLTVTAEAPRGPVFLGSEFTVMLRVFGAPDASIGVTAERSEGPVRLVRVVEDRISSTSGPIRELTWVFRAEGEGALELGPFQVWAGQRTASRRALHVDLLAPPRRGEPPADLPPFELRTPSEILAGRTAPNVLLGDGFVDVLTAPGDVVRASPRLDRLSAVEWQLRKQGTVQWSLLRVPLRAITPSITVRREGELVAEFGDQLQQRDAAP